MSWPEEYGGAGLSEVERIVLAEEFAKAGVPEGNENDGFSITMAKRDYPMRHRGTKRQLLPE